MSKQSTRPEMWSAIGGECTIEEPFASEHGGMFLGFTSLTSTGHWPKGCEGMVRTDSNWFHAYSFGETIQEIPIEPPSSIDKWITKSMRRIRGVTPVSWSSCWRHMDDEERLGARTRAKELAKAVGTERRDIVVDHFRQDWDEQKRCVGDLAIHGIIDHAIEQGILRAARHQPWEEGCLLVFLRASDDGSLISSLTEHSSLVVERV